MKHGWNTGPRTSRRQVLASGGAAALGLMTPFGRRARADDAPVMLKPFDPNRPAGKAPKDLPARIGAVNPSPGGLNQTIEDSMRKGAKDFDIEFVAASGNGTAESVVEQGTLILNRGVGMFYSFLTSLDAEAPMLHRALDAGVNCANVAGYPCTMQINGSQAAAGAKQANAAIAWIKAKKLGDDAQVVYLNNAKSPFSCRATSPSAPPSPRPASSSSLTRPRRRRRPKAATRP
jgi:hypothetical protein